MRQLFLLLALLLLYLPMPEALSAQVTYHEVTAYSAPHYCRPCGQYHSWGSTSCYYSHRCRCYYDPWIRDRGQRTDWPSSRNNPLISELSR